MVAYGTQSERFSFRKRLQKIPHGQKIQEYVSLSRIMIRREKRMRITETEIGGKRS